MIFRKTGSRLPLSMLFFVSSFLFSYPVTACPPRTNRWTLGLSTGYTRNELYTNISNYDYNYYKKEGGFVVSVPLRYSFTGWLALQAEPGYMQKAFSLWQALPSEPVTRLTSRYNYLQLPLIAHFSFGTKKFVGFINLGAYSSWWLSGHIKGTELDGFNYTYPVFRNFTQDVDATYEFDSRRDRRLQFGCLAGGGIQYILSNKFEIFAEVRYYSDLTDQQQAYMRNQVPRYNMTTSVTAGCLFHLSARKH